MMQHALIERAMSFHRMRPQAVHLHDIVDGAVRAFDAIVERTQIAFGLLVFDVFDPHGKTSVRLLSGALAFNQIVLSMPPCHSASPILWSLTRAVLAPGAATARRQASRGSRRCRHRRGA